MIILPITIFASQTKCNQCVGYSTSAIRVQYILYRHVYWYMWGIDVLFYAFIQVEFAHDFVPLFFPTLKLPNKPNWPSTSFTIRIDNFAIFFTLNELFQKFPMDLTLFFFFTHLFPRTSLCTCSRIKRNVEKKRKKKKNHRGRGGKKKNRKRGNWYGDESWIY